MQRLRLFGDIVHVGAILVFLAVVGIKGNASGLSLKSQWLYLASYMMRYIDLFFTYYSIYNTAMKCFFIMGTACTIYIMTQREPAKSTYSPSMDAFPATTSLLIPSILAGMVIHVIGSGAVNVRGASGQEFEVHFQHFSLLSWLWTCSLCLEPLAMIPQLYIFRKHRLISKDIRFGIFLLGLYRLFYVCFWTFRAKKQEFFQHHYLLYLSGAIQVLTYADFFFYHWSVSMLWFLTRCSGVMGDGSNMIADSGMEAWALTATGGEFMGDAGSSSTSRTNRNTNDNNSSNNNNNKSEWQPGDAPAEKSIEMRRAGGMGVV